KGIGDEFVRVTEFGVAEHLAFALGERTVWCELRIVLVCQVVPFAVALEVFDDGPAARDERAPEFHRVLWIAASRAGGLDSHQGILQSRPRVAGLGRASGVLDAAVGRQHCLRMTS